MLKSLPALGSQNGPSCPTRLWHTANKPPAPSVALASGGGGEPVRVATSPSLETVKTLPVRRYGAPEIVRTAPSEVVTEGVRVCGVPEGSIVTQSFTAARGRRAEVVAGVRSVRNAR